MDSLLADLTLAAVPFLAGMVVTWRVVWPRWKLGGKAVAYFSVVALLSLAVGRWSVLLAWAHQGLGMSVHLWFCRQHGFVWYAVDDPERYIRLSKQMVGYVEPSETPRRTVLDGVRLPDNITMQCEGERPGVEWCVRVDDELG